MRKGRRIGDRENIVGKAGAGARKRNPKSRVTRRMTRREAGVVHELQGRAGKE